MARVSVGIAEVLVADTGFMLQVTPFRTLDIESVAALAAAAADRF